MNERPNVNIDVPGIAIAGFWIGLGIALAGEAIARAL